MSLVPCSSCSRHVRASDTACPFCGVRAAIPAIAPRALSGLSRAMIVLGGAVAIGSAIEACGGETVPTAVPVYGAPASVEDAGPSVPNVAPSASSTGSLPSPPPTSATAAPAPSEKPAALPGSAVTASPTAAMANGYGGPPAGPPLGTSPTAPTPKKKP